MFLTLRIRESSYESLINECTDVREEQEFRTKLCHNRGHRFGTSTLALLVVALALLSGFLAGTLFTSQREYRKTACTKPVVRREWRSLATREKRDYIQAVQRLTSKPSLLGRNQTLYHDFPTIHYEVGGNSHESVLFLVWHQYFIYVYEMALKNQCNYSGNLA
jgi:hypothetical protein